MTAIPDIILHDPNNVSQKLVRGRREHKPSVPVMKDTKTSGSGGGGGGGKKPGGHQKSNSVKHKNKNSGYSIAAISIQRKYKNI
jgi:hypothetical protein